jgi:hypothetical protein
MWYKGTLTDKNTKRKNGQPNSIKYRSQDLSKVFDFLTAYIKDCNLTDVGIRIKHEPLNKRDL